MNVYFILAVIFYYFMPILSQEIHLEVFKEEELLQLFKDEKYVIVLLSEEEHCINYCEELENSLLSIREDLVEATGGWVIRSHAPEFCQRMGIQGSTLVFMRDGKPLVYAGNSQDEEQILNHFLMNKISSVHNLTDSNFEHETQAGTGATTGDWLIMFTREDCKTCQKLWTTLENISVNLKGTKNVGFLEREFGAVTARRFSVKEYPTFILFRLGKLYRYSLDKVDSSSLTSFAKDYFRNMKAEDVPPPKSPFDDLTEAMADWLRENPGTFLLSFSGMILILGFIYLLNRPPPEAWIKKSKTKKS